jgi:hypothetical protein
MQNYHVTLVGVIQDVWNYNNAKFENGEIITFINRIRTHETTILSYGMTEPRFKESYNELVSTFCTRCFRNIMPMILEV